MIKNVPKNFKYSTIFSVNSSVFIRFCFLKYYNIGLVACEDFVIYYKELFAVFKLLKKNLKKQLKVRFNISLILPFTRKSLGTRMGKGKGARKGFCYFVRRGEVLFEMVNNVKFDIRYILDQCKLKISGNVKVMKFRI